MTACNFTNAFCFIDHFLAINDGGDFWKKFMKDFMKKWNILEGYICEGILFLVVYNFAKIYSFTGAYKELSFTPDYLWQFPKMFGIDFLQEHIFMATCELSSKHLLNN